jgi:biotin carboxylase
MWTRRPATSPPATKAVPLPGSTPVETYLNVGRILEAATSTGAEAIHPGYGFLSERGDVASRVAEADWSGSARLPRPRWPRATSSKLAAWP